MQTWEFRFACVQHGETYEEALQAALAYLAEYASKGELEPVESKQIEGPEDD